MIVVISPSKTLDYESQIHKTNHTIPEFLAESNRLIDILRKKTPAKISELMDISEKLAKLNYERYQNFHTPFTIKNSRQAIFAFKGDVYEGIRVENYNQKDFDFAQNHLRIISGLYGLLKPLDLMQPYRLEMGINLKNSAGKDLYEFWRDKITQKLSHEVNEQEDKLLINLASQEYFKVVKKDKLEGKILNIIFKEEQKGQLKIIGLFAKKARGEMASFIIKNRIKKANDLKLFTENGYNFSKSISDDENYVFIRKTTK